MDEKPCVLTDQLKLELSIRITIAFIHIHYGNFIVSHNDISHDNILLDIEMDGKNNNEIKITKLVLADFGISTVMKEFTQQTTFTTVEGFGGKRYFAAPEQFNGEGFK